MRFEPDTRYNLELDKVLLSVSQYCVSEIGKNRILHAQPLDDKVLLKRILNEIEEGKAIIESEGGIPLIYFRDMRDLLHKIEPEGSYLEIEEIIAVQTFLDLSNKIYDYFKKNKEKYPLLSGHALSVHKLSSLLKLIENTIDISSGEIFDNASPELKQIRAEINRLRKLVHIKLDRIIRKQSEHLQDNYMTLREGRLVLPVREYSTNKIPGIVHGQSGTGQTHFIEPIEVVELNNQLHDQVAREQKEIIKILIRLADHLRQNSAEILSDFDILCYLDVIEAKSRFARKMKCNAPLVTDKFEWTIKTGYHPLLYKKIGRDTVPANLSLGSDFRILLISGPNAGGKTVSLKTVGLLQVLFQSGFQIPVAADSVFPMCEAVFAVIGDEQSIENDLSTFSSHIQKIKNVLNHLKHRSLVLIDEIGSGTDPGEGSALAIAILENLNKNGIITIATTHHGALKLFAQEKKMISNAAMQFDTKSLRPLFALETGIPGSSYAFDISMRLGLDDNILSHARSIMGSDYSNLDKMVKDLSAMKQKYKNELDQIMIKKSEMEGYRSLYKSRSYDLSKKKKEHEKQAVEEARKILNDVNKTIENLIREIRESNAATEVIKKSKRTVSKLKDNLDQKLQATSPKQEIQEPDIDSLKTGQKVKSVSFGIKGEISKIFTDRKEIEIDSDGIKISVGLDDIMVLKDGEYSRLSGETVVHHHTPGISNEIDLRGKLADEAVFDLEKYLDAALTSEWDEVRIIHGKGTGALRKQIHTFLKKHNKIKSFRLGKFGEGDTGVTVVEL